MIAISPISSQLQTDDLIVPSPPGNFSRDYNQLTDGENKIHQAIGYPQPAK
jgi:hypothetical protein